MQAAQVACAGYVEPPAEKYPEGHFVGKNFVFDDRMVTNTDTKSGEQVLGKCAHCKKASDRYIDCAKPDCHQLFICCKEVLVNKVNH